MRSALSTVRREFDYPPLLVLLAVGVAMRAGLFAFYSPGILYSLDSARFTRTLTGFGSMFDDYWMPAGYSGYLTSVHWISSELWVPIALQHLIAIAAALAVFLALRRIDLSKGVATCAVAILILPGDLLFLEHAVLIESLMLSLICFALAAAIRGLTPTVDLRWLAVAGAFAGASMAFRSVAIVVVPAAILVAVLATPSGWRRRLGSGAIVAAGTTAILLLYLGAFKISDGRYLGFTDMSGWNMYSRIAPFAQCKDFDPPRGTAYLCEHTPPEDRPGPSFYAWASADPSPAVSKVRGRFADAAIAAQPTDYAGAVVTDLARYVVPGLGDREFSGVDGSFMLFDNPDLHKAGVFPSAREWVAHRYSGVSGPRSGASLLAGYQRIARIHGWLLPLLAIIAVAGALTLGRGSRIAIGLLGLTSAGLFVVPVATFAYDYRYGVPAAALLAIAALIAVAGMIDDRRPTMPAR